MQAGKLPIEQLSKVLQKFTSRDPRVVLGPAPGEDAALIDMGESYLVAKTDPITFATNRIGWYAVQVNANDIAVMGAKPKWMMATILLPEGTSENTIEQIFSQLDQACNSLDITIIGGHTEITYDLSRPLITGVMLGEVEKGKEIRSSGARPGDSIILTKSIAIEGCSILALECESKLRSYGVSNEDIDQGKNLLNNPGISIVRDAEIAMASGRVTSMHDPTEGGLAGGLRELAQAAALGMNVKAKDIPINNVTSQFCSALEIDPLGLIASGSLLITSNPKDDQNIIDSLASEGISASIIGFMQDQSHGLNLVQGKTLGEIPNFSRDELARILSQ